MPSRLLLLLAAIHVAGGVASAAAVTRLVLVGGGERPRAALARFVEWAGGPAARVLVVPWASGEAEESCNALVAELREHGPAEVVCAPPATLDAQGKAAPLEPEKAAAV